MSAREGSRQRMVMGFRARELLDAITGPTAKGNRSYPSVSTCLGSLTDRVPIRVPFGAGQSSGRPSMVFTSRARFGAVPEKPVCCRELAGHPHTYLWEPISG